MPGRVKYFVALLCGSRYNWIIVPGIRCQNGSKKAKYEKISCLEEPDVFSGGWGSSWRWEGIMDASTINVHKNSSKLIFSKINFYDFFLKNYGPGSETGFSKAWIRLHKKTMAFGEKIDLYKKSKNLPQKQFSRHSLVRRPYWQKIVKPWFFLEKTKFTNCS